MKIYFSQALKISIKFNNDINRLFLRNSWLPIDDVRVSVEFV